LKRIFVGDFETTVYKNQTFTEVWASALVELYTEDVIIHHSIKDTFEYLASLPGNVLIYYHNLKFDGAFYLSYLLTELKYEQAFLSFNEEGTKGKWLDNKEMKNKSFKFSQSFMGQWYSITIKVNNKFIEIRDSLKLLPFPLKRIGKAFKTKHQKLDMEYTGFRYAGCEITDSEKEYIKNDVLVIKEALEIMFDEGHDKMTIGACCLSEYKKLLGKEDYKMYFPDLTQIGLNKKLFKYDNVDAYIRKSYKGGWCYLVKGKENKIYNNGVTADVNSLYSSMMHSESGNRYPVGNPHFWSGNYIDDEAIKPNRYYFIRIKTRFYLKEGYLPFIQIKSNLLYKPNECLTSSDYYDEKTGLYHDKYYLDGVLTDTRVELVLTMTDYELLKEHYELVDFEILDGCWFFSEIGLFDYYIDKYKKIKMSEKGAKRELAKLFLNNLYGKLGASTDSSFKKAYVKDDNSIGFITINANDKKPGYVSCGSAITSYARNFTIRAAQKNYHGVDKPGFIYADTDSIHCDIPPQDIKGIKVSDNDFCCWKLESTWDKAIFVRQKTYVEHVTEENLKPCEPYYNVKCAGMPQRCKDLFELSMNGYTNEEFEKLNGIEKEFVQTKRELTDFKIGLVVPSKLLPKRIPGGVLLTETTFEMR
jgi:hypothetical protein